MNILNLSRSAVAALLRSQGFATEHPAEPGKPERPGFTITISREVGALGNAVARELGQRTNWPVYDQEILNKMAESMGKPLEKLRPIDERHVSWLEECLQNLQSEYRISPDFYLKHLIGAIRGLGAMGKCIIVGRGANCILSPETTLRVRLVADLPDRIKVIQQVRGLSAADAAAFIKKTDPQRAAFIRNNFGKDPNDAHLYDLVLNTSRFNVDDCCNMILDALARLEKKAGRVSEPAASASS